MTKKIALLFIIFFVTQNTFAQKEKTAQEVKKMIWPANDIAQTYKATADQEKDQSGVILYQKKYYNYKKKNKFAFSERYFRRRIKLLDKAAVKEYSDFKYNDEKYSKYWGSQNTRKIKGVRYFNVKVIKPDGKEIIVDLKKYTVKEDDEKKIAIPNLQVGDIVDYYYYNYKRQKAPQGYDFPSVESALVSYYPIVKYDIDINLEHSFYFNFKNVNGAPDLKPAKAAEPKQKRYVLSMENLASKKTEHWIFPYVAYPSIKFQVYFIPNSGLKKYANGFIAKEKGVVKKNVSQEEVLDYYKRYTFYAPSRSKKTKPGVKEKILEHYEVMRFNSLIKYIPVIESGDNTFNIYLLGTNYSLKDEDDFINDMTLYLSRLKINYEVIALKSRPYGNNKDLILAENMHLLLKVYLPNGEILYLEPIKNEPLNRIAGEINPYFEGNTGYAMDLKGKKVKTIKPTSIPVTTKDENTLERNVKVSFAPDFKQINFENKITATGHKKGIRAIYTRPYQYIAKDYKKNKSTQFFDFGGRNKRKERKKRYDAYINKEAKKHQKKLKEYIEEKYDAKIDNYKLNIDNYGRYHEQPDFVMTENFVVTDGFTKKAGKNILFQAGKLLGKQIHIDKDELDRTEDVYRSFASTTKHNITIDIPEGYTVKGLNKFNKTISNETGSFVSKAEQKGNQVIIKVTESYNHIFEPNKNWQKLVDILQTAYQLSQKKLLFKK